MENFSNSCPPRKHLTKEERFPKCYRDVEKILRTVKSCQGNYKTVLANSRHRGAHFKKIYGMTVNILKYYNYIQEILNQTHLLEKEKFLRPECAFILIYEIIFGKGYLPGESKAVSVVRKYENDIFNVHQKLESNVDKFLADFSVPRYVRVNTLVTTVAYVIKDLEKLGYHEVSYDSDFTEAKYLELVRSLDPGSFLVDFHFKDMLVFEHSEKLIHLDIYKNGHILLQDKASYIPVHALNPESGSAVLDACAAPGMKTVHIASKMKNKGILIACERDKNRFESLKEMIQYGSVKIAKMLCKDFRSLDPMDQAYSTVEYILLDPSCSGSGMVSCMDEVTDTKDSKNKERLMKLSGFQIILLKHALKFPSVKKVVYSTCSIHEEENERVVHEVLEQFQDTFKLISVMPEWSERGLDNYEFGHLCLRTVPEKHMMNGFFVAMFERIGNYDYGKGMRFSKNRKFKRNSDALLESHGAEKTYDDLNSSFVKNNEVDENILNEKKFESLQKQSHGFQNDSYLPSNNFGKEVSILNTTVENNDIYNGNLGKETSIKDVEHDPNVNRKHKKKKRKEDSVENFSHSNKELTNDETSILAAKDTSNGNLEKIYDFNHDSNVIEKHKKKKRSRKSSIDNCYHSKELINEIDVLTTKHTLNENIEKEQTTIDIKPESKSKKKHKRKKTREDSHEIICNDNEELTNVLVIDENNVLTNKANCNEMLDKETGSGFDQDTNVSKKHKKKKRRHNSLEILCPPSAELTNEIMGSEIKMLATKASSCIHERKELATENFECNSNISKKHKKKRKSKDSSEFFCESSEESNNVLMANENSILNRDFNENSLKEPAIEYFDYDSKVNKKHKKKKKKKDSPDVSQPSEEHITKLFGNETHTLQVKEKHEKCINFENIDGKDVSTHKLKKRKKHENVQEDQKGNTFSFEEKQENHTEIEKDVQEDCTENVPLKRKKKRKH